MTGKRDGSNSMLHKRPVPWTLRIEEGNSVCKAVIFSTISMPLIRIFSRNSGVMVSNTAVAVSSARGLVVMVFP